MFKTALIKNLIPHTWKLANIVPIPKPNKDTDKGSSYRPISLLSVIAKTLEKSLLPYITANTPMHHGYKTQHSTVTALHTLNNTVAKGFNQMAPPARTITVTLDMSKAFDTINIHTLIRKLLQTNIPGTIIKFIANYIKGRKAYATYRNRTSKQRQFKTGVPQGGVLSPTLLNIYTSDLPPPSAQVQVMAYADDITITSTHTSTSAAKKYIQPYLHKVFAWTKQNNLLLNPDKTICTMFRPDPAEYTSNLDLTINNKALPMAMHPKALGLTLDQKLTYSTHIHISVQVHTPLQIIKIQDRITYKILMLTYKSYYNIAPTYLCELISRRESSVNTRLGSDQHQLIMPPISKDCSNTFLDRSFIYAAPCEWNKSSECIRTSSFDSFRKSVKTMLFTQQYG